MTPLNALDALMVSLTEAEERFIQGRLVKEKLDLFNAVLLQKKSEQEDLGPAFAKLTHKSFLVKRSRLAVEIAKLLHEFRNPQSIFGQIHGLEQIAATHQANGLFPKAINFFMKAAKKAATLEAFDLARNLAASAVLMMDEEDVEADPIVEVRDGYTLRHGEIMQLEVMILEIKPIKRLQEPHRRNRATQLFERLNALSEPQSLKGQIHFVRLKGFCLVFTGFIEEAFALMEPLRLRLLASPRLSFDAPLIQSLVSIHMALSGMYIHFGKADAAIELLKKFVTWLEAGKLDVPTIIQLEQAKAAIVAAWQRRDFLMFDRLANNLRKEMEGGKYPNANRRLSLSIYLAESYIELGKPKKAIQWIDEAFKDRAAEVIQENLAVGGFMGLACWYMLQDWARLELEVGNMVYLLKTRHQMNAYTKAVMKGFKAVVRNRYSAKEALMELVEDIQPFIGNPDYRVLMEAFDVTKWVKSQF